jgi:hypothetical protein
LLKHSLVALSPDLVICNFDMSDVADDHRCRRYVRMKGPQPLYCPHPELEWERSATERFWVQRLLMWRHGERGLGYVFGTDDQPEDGRDINSPKGMYAWLRDDAPDWSVYIEQTLGVIGQTAELCSRSSCKFVLTIVPCPWQVSAEASNGPGVRSRCGVPEHVLYTNRAPQQMLAAFAKKEGIPFCDVSRLFARFERPERLFLKNAARFSATGHDLYARIVGSFVEQNIPGPWKLNGGTSPSEGGSKTIGANGGDRAPVKPAEFHRPSADTSETPDGRSGDTRGEQRPLELRASPFED